MKTVICPHCSKPNPIHKLLYYTDWMYGETNRKSDSKIIYCGSNEEMDGGCEKRFLVEWVWVPEILVSPIGERAS